MAIMSTSTNTNGATVTSGSTWPTVSSSYLISSATPAFTWNMPASGSSYNYSTSTLGTVQVVPSVTFSDSNNTEYLRITSDGKCIWREDLSNDEAAKRFSDIFQLSKELNAGITKEVKETIRDHVFEEIILACEKRGSMTVEDLRFMYESVKIMDRLKTTY